MIILLAGCSEKRTYIYRSPSNEVSVMVWAEGEKEPGPGRRNEVFFLGAAPPKPEEATTYPPAERVKLGEFVGVWHPGAIAWIDEATVNVCPLEGVAGVPTSARVLVTETARRTFRITTDCPAFLRVPSPRRPPA